MSINDPTSNILRLAAICTDENHELLQDLSVQKASNPKIPGYNRYVLWSAGGPAVPTAFKEAKTNTYGFWIEPCIEKQTPDLNLHLKGIKYKLLVELDDKSSVGNLLVEMLSGIHDALELGKPYDSGGPNTMRHGFILSMKPNTENPRLWRFKGNLVWQMMLNLLPVPASEEGKRTPMEVYIIPQEVRDMYQGKPLSLWTLDDIFKKPDQFKGDSPYPLTAIVNADPAYLGQESRIRFTFHQTNVQAVQSEMVVTLPDEALLASRKPGAIGKPKFTIAPSSSEFSGPTNARTVQFTIKPTEVGEQKIYLCLFGSTLGVFKRLSSWELLTVNIKPYRYLISDRNWCDRLKLLNSNTGTFVLTAWVRQADGNWPEKNLDLEGLVGCEDGKLFWKRGGPLKDNYVNRKGELPFINGTKLVGSWKKKNYYEIPLGMANVDLIQKQLQTFGRAEIDLAERIWVKDGNLVYMEK